MFIPFTGTYYRNLLQEPTTGTYGSPYAPPFTGAIYIYYSLNFVNYRNLLQEPTVPRTPLPFFRSDRRERYMNYIQLLFFEFCKYKSLIFKEIQETYGFPGRPFPFFGATEGSDI